MLLFIAERIERGDKGENVSEIGVDWEEAGVGFRTEVDVTGASDVLKLLPSSCEAEEKTESGSR